MPKSKPLNPLSFSETRGRKKKYNHLSAAYARLTELRYVKECMKAILENGAYHESNMEDFISRHTNLSSKSHITSDEMKTCKRLYERRNIIAKDIKNKIDKYLDEVEKNEL